MNELETFTLKIMCAVHDKPFIVEFLRHNDGLYRPSETIEFGSMRFTIVDADHRDSQQRGVEVSMERLRMSRIICPHCKAHHANMAFFRCGECDEYICSGRRTETSIACRSSCGYVAGMSSVTPLKKVHATPPVPGFDETASFGPGPSAGSSSRALVVREGVQ